MAAWLIAALVAAALFLFVRHRRNRVLGGLPTGELIAADNEGQECPVLISHRFGLKGKPDALVRTKGGAVIPVERKRTIAPPRGPYDSDLIRRLPTAFWPDSRPSSLPRRSIFLMAPAVRGNDIGPLLAVGIAKEETARLSSVKFLQGYAKWVWI